MWLIKTGPLHNGHTENDELIYYNEISPIRVPEGTSKKKILIPYFRNLKIVSVSSLVGKYIYNVYIVTSLELCFP